jgi:pSer/pThr/pTyr-binding forkhead associated (FHA) protein
VNYRLEVVQGPDRGKWCSFTNAQVMIGRDVSSSDLLLSDTSVSRRHARITAYDGGVFHLEDLDSTGGTFVNGTRISEVVSVGENDSIEVGGSILRLVYAHELALASNETEATASVSIGRDPANNLVIDSPEVSRQHALIERRSGRYYLTDLASSRGTFLDGNQISGTVELKPAQWIHISGYDFFFDGENLQDAQGAYLVCFNIGTFQSGETLSIKEILLLPFAGLNKLKWLIGSLLAMIPFVAFFAEGYRYRLIQESLKGSLSMPDWENWGELFIKGLLFVLIRIIYTFVPFLAAAISIYIVFGMQNPSYGLLNFFLIMLAFIYLTACFCLPMGWAQFVRTGSFKEAFNFKEIYHNIKNYLTPYVTLIFLIVGMWIILILLALIPLFGFIVGVLGIFYIQIVLSLLAGEILSRTEKTATRGDLVSFG